MKIEEINCDVALGISSDTASEKIMNESYFLLRDMESFPDYMENVSKVVENPVFENCSVIEWNCLVDDAEFRWVQKTVFDEPGSCIRFELVEGDLQTLEGTWKVCRKDGKIFLGINMKYSIGLPVIEEVLGPVLKDKFENNLLSMLNSIKAKIECKYEK